MTRFSQTRQRFVDRHLLAGEHDRTAHAGRLGHHVIARDRRAALIRAAQGRQDVHDRGLARPVRAEQAEHLTATDLEADPVQGHKLAEGLADACRRRRPCRSPYVRCSFSVPSARVKRRQVHQRQFHGFRGHVAVVGDGFDGVVDQRPQRQRESLRERFGAGRSTRGGRRTTNRDAARRNAGTPEARWHGPGPGMASRTGIAASESNWTGASTAGSSGIMPMYRKWMSDGPAARQQPRGRRIDVAQQPVPDPVVRNGFEGVAYRGQQLGSAHCRCVHGSGAG